MGTETSGIPLWANRIIRAGFALLFILVPLILTPWNYELFEYNKMMVTYGLTVIIAAAWLVKMIAQKEIRIARTPLDIPLALFLSSQLLSSLFSMDPHVSWFGYYSRFNGGMWSVISYVLLYYAFVSNYKDYNDYKNYIKISLATGVAVALYGVAERLGVDKHLWVQDVQNRVFSSLGQPNWLAAYLTALSPIAMALGLSPLSLRDRSDGAAISPFRGLLRFARNDTIQCALWNTVAVLFFLVLLFTRSRSGLLGFAIADVVFWGLVFLQKKRPLIPFVILHISFVILFIFYGPSLPIPSLSRPPVTEASASASYTAPLLETGGTESGTIRKYVWQGAILAWKSSVKTFLIGTGTETFAFAFFQYRPGGHNMTSEWDFLYNKAHNEYLNYLATTGIFGLGSYLLLIGVFMYWFISKFLISNYLSSKQIPNSKSQLDQLGQLEIRNFTSIALFAGWLSILVTNFFGFSVVIVQLFLFLFPAMMMTSDKTYSLKFSLPYRLSLFLTLLALLVFLIILSKMWYADTLFAAGYRLARANQYVQAQPLIRDAIALNGGEPLYHDEYSTTLAALTAQAVQEQQATLAASLAKQALTESDTAISISPKNVNFWKSRTKIFYSFSSFDPQFNPAAIQALTRAQELSPNDPKIFYNLAILFGRQNDNAKAIELLQKAIAIKPDYRDAYFALSIFYQETKNAQKAREILQEYLKKVDPNEKDFLERMK